MKCCISMTFALAVCLLTIAVPASAQTSGDKANRGVATVLQPFVDSHTLAGAVTAVASKDKVLDLTAVGYADVPAKKPMQTNCIFWIASMSKPMTATALMMLVDEGKVNLDDPVEKYLPEFKGRMVVVEQDDNHALLKKPVHPITVRNVLSHTSGLPFMSRVEQKIDTYTLREAVLTYALTPLKFQPDSKWDYSNAGINTAGRIIEVVSGMAYEEFMAKRLFEPLGMKDTTFWPNDEQLTRLAKSYTPNAEKTGLTEIPIGQMTYPLGARHRGPCPAGGLFATAADVAQFGRMILCGGTLDGRRYVSETSVRQLTSTQTNNLLNDGKSENGYGLGLSTTKKLHSDKGPAVVGPCGHGGAYATDLWIDPDRGLVTIYMVQHAGYPGNDGGKILPAFRKAAADAFGK